MSQMSIFDIKMNINQIPYKPVYGNNRLGFKDFEVNMEDAIEEPPIKNWIENQQMIEHPEILKEELLNNPKGPHVRVRFDKRGNITEMNISEYGAGYLCSMSYSNPENWPRLIEMIKKANEVITCN